jgi:hypothetical protein
MSFIGFDLGVGKRVALWDSNLHKDNRATVPLAAGVLGRYKLKYSLS